MKDKLYYEVINLLGGTQVVFSGTNKSVMIELLQDLKSAGVIDTFIVHELDQDGELIKDYCAKDYLKSEYIEYLKELAKDTQRSEDIRQSVLKNIEDGLI